MHVLKKYLVVEYSSSRYQLGDLLTKPLQDKDLWNYTANLYCLCYLCNNFFFFFYWIWRSWHSRSFSIVSFSLLSHSYYTLHLTCKISSYNSKTCHTLPTIKSSIWVEFDKYISISGFSYLYLWTSYLTPTCLVRIILVTCKC